MKRLIVGGFISVVFAVGTYAQTVTPEQTKAATEVLATLAVWSRCVIRT